MSDIIVITNTVGNLATNCYTVVNTKTRQAVMIDPAANADFLINMIKNQNYKLQGLLLTHGHGDHIGAVGKIKKEFEGLKLYCSEDEVDVLAKPDVNLSLMLGEAMSYVADDTFRDGQVVNLIGVDMICLKTPGHTEGGMCYYFPTEKMVFAGDTLFEDSVGRTDFPTGSASTLVKSIQEKLFVLPDDVTVYTGHGPSTAIGTEKQFNPYAGMGL